MKADVVGELRNLGARDRQLLERLSDKRSSPRDVINVDLARRIAALAAQLGSQIGVLIGRDGRLTHIVVGTKGGIFLPDLGRFRLEAARLRRLRLVVFVPEGRRTLRRQAWQPFPYSNIRQGSRQPSAVMLIEAPEIARDLITDLEKLRLDSLLVVSVNDEGEPGPVTFAHLDPGSTGGKLWQEKERGGGSHHLTYVERSLPDFLAFDYTEFIADLESQLSTRTRRLYDSKQERAILVGAYTGTEREAHSSMEELKELARTAGVVVVDTVIQRRRELDPKTVIGRGKIEELVLHTLDLGVELLVFDGELTPGQLRSITQMTDLRVIDRSMLILDIFAQRAVSSEGRLQVELAQLKYSLPRLTEKDTGLSRLTGGIGGRGPGETKLEIGRRRTRDRIADLERKIDKLADQRALRRGRRQERGLPVFAIVGYTNAGKSTLLNALTKGSVLAESRMFATLDPASRRMRFPNEKEVIFVDTVGFIRELPEELIAAFRATLEEVAEADFLVHVVDATNPEVRAQIDVVERTLDSLGIGNKPKLLVLNKVDRLTELETLSLVNTVGGLPVSAVTRSGLDTLTAILEQALASAISREKAIASGAVSEEERSEVTPHGLNGRAAWRE